MADYGFALTVDDPDMVAVIDYQGVCWPMKNLLHARELAKEVGVAGVWRVKQRHQV